MYELYIDKDINTYLIINKLSDLAYWVDLEHILEGIRAVDSKNNDSWPYKEASIMFKSLTLIETFTKESHPEYFV